METIVQNELFCKYRGSWGSGARIPKIEFFAKMKINNKYVGVIAMESLGKDCTDLLYESDNSDKYDIIIKDMVVKVSHLLSRLQKDYVFMHRDLHCGNVMYKKIGNAYRWYIIDFGMSMMNFNNKVLKVRETFPYDINHTFNPSHDLRLLFTSMFGVFYDKLITDGKSYVPRNMFNITFRLTESLSRYLYIDPDNTALFHNTYEDVVEIYDENFTPEYVIDTLKININTRMKKNNVYSIILSNNVYHNDNKKRVRFIGETTLSRIINSIRKQIIPL